MQDSRLDDLRLLYTLFGRVPTGHAALQAAVSKWIVEIGGKVNEGLLVVLERGDDEGAADPKGKGKAKEDAGGDTDMKPDVPAVKKKPEAPGNAKTKAALAWVQNVLDLKDKFDAILTKAFSGDKAFEKSINDVSLQISLARDSALTAFLNRPSPSLSTKTLSRPSTSRSSSTRTSRRDSRGCVSLTRRRARQR